MAAKALTVLLRAAAGCTARLPRHEQPLKMDPNQSVTSVAKIEIRVLGTVLATNIHYPEQGPAASVLSLCF
jgi:hypothetical protein